MKIYIKKLIIDNRKTRKFRKQILTKAKAKQKVNEKGLSHYRFLGISDFAVLIIDILEKHFKKHPDGFDKHGMDCADQKELDGECWEKELGYSKPTFKKYFEEIGNIYLTPEEAEKAESMFGDKRYCSILDYSNNKRTKYLKNPNINDNLENELNLTE